jgi:AbrB family looped-hinge helix DNA binding protein
MTSKGQITVPVEVRTALGLRPGDQVAFVSREDGVVEIHPRTRSITSLFGCVRPSVRGVTDAELDEAIIEGAVRGESR